MSWLKFLDKPKDFVIKSVLQRYFGRYIHRILELSIDRENKKLHVIVELVGEDEPIAIDTRYEINLNETVEEVRLTANSVSISREWMDLLAQEFVGQEFVLKGKDSARWIKLVKDLGLV